MARSRRRRRDSSDKVTGLILLVVAVIVLSALGVGTWWVRKSKVVLDAENCPVSGPQIVHLVMIDRSDPISGQQVQRIRQYMQKAKDDATFGTRFDFYTFEGDIKNEMRPVIRVCAPGKPEDANELIENPDLIRRRYDENFSAVIDKTVNDLTAANTKDNSPIIESLRGAAITSFGSINPSKVKLRATLVSDMVQHTSAVSHFRTAPDFQALSKTMAWASLRPTLSGAEVNIIYLLRPNAIRAGAPIQNRGHQLFWEQLIGASNGRVRTIEPI
jgi:uncharacterized protein YneF (UPF0154 family)